MVWMSFGSDQNKCVLQSLIPDCRETDNIIEQGSVHELLQGVVYTIFSDPNLDWGSTKKYKLLDTTCS